MENEIKKCSLKIHNRIDAIAFCKDCELYLCNKCYNNHIKLYEKETHTIINIDKNINDCHCNEEKHKDELKYYCQTHNILCCESCINEIKIKGNNNDNDCKVCNIEEIKEEKKKKLKENIDYLENLSKTLDKIDIKLKEKYEKIIKGHEEIKINVKKIFAKIRNTLIEKENKILSLFDKEYENIYFNEDLIEISENMKNQIKFSLKKGKLIQNQWVETNFKLNSFINTCINIENDIKNIDIMNKKISKFLSINFKINFCKEEQDINTLIEKMSFFGIVDENDDKKEVKKDKKVKKNFLRKREPLIYLDTPLTKDKMLKKYKDYFLHIFDFLDFKEQIILSGINKVFIKERIYLLNTKREEAIPSLELNEKETINDRLNNFIKTYQKCEYTKPLAPFIVPRPLEITTPFLNNPSCFKIYNILDIKFKEIYIIYRIFFVLLGELKIAELADDNKFFEKCVEYLNTKGNKNIGSFILEKSKSFDFSQKSIYLINKLFIGIKPNFTPEYFNKINLNTFFLIILIREALIYAGVIITDKTQKSRIYNNLVYYKNLIQNLSAFILNLSKIN